MYKKTAQTQTACNGRVPAAEPSVSIHFHRGLSNEGKREMPFSARGTFRKRKACGLTSSVPIDVWHSLRHSSRSLVARHKLAGRGRGGGWGMNKRNADTIADCMDYYVDPPHHLLGRHKPNWNIRNDLFPVPTSPQRLERIITLRNSQYYIC
jgi:hypothetical protein